MMDRNSLIGLVLISTLLIGYMFYMQPSAEELKQKRVRDSLALVQKEAEVKTKQQAVVVPAKTDTITVGETKLADTTTTVNADSISAANKAKAYGIFAPAVSGDNKIETIENELVKVNISSKGGRIASVELTIQQKQYDHL